MSRILYAVHNENYSCVKDLQVSEIKHHNTVYTYDLASFFYTLDI